MPRGVVAAEEDGRSTARGRPEVLGIPQGVVEVLGISRGVVDVLGTSRGVVDTEDDWDRLVGGMPSIPGCVSPMSCTGAWATAAEIWDDGVASDIACRSLCSCKVGTTGVAARSATNSATFASSPVSWALASSIAQSGWASIRATEMLRSLLTGFVLLAVLTTGKPQENARAAEMWAQRGQMCCQALGGLFGPHALLLGRVHPEHPDFYPLPRWGRANAWATKSVKTPLLPTNMAQSRAQYNWPPLHNL